MLGTSACGSNNPTTTPDTSTPTAVTETNSDTLTVNGGKTQPFTVSKAGTVTATVVALDPDPAVVFGLSLGTFNGSSCTLIVTNDSAALNVTVTGTAQAAGSYCARIYDVGKLTAPTNYTLQITHF
ncbi:MAG TPA: hypothetical protein VKB50_01030 [Vicinamibacterales bacterium]|nr:hypothetical protein [Vicinamibacterales bacterium]